MSRYARYDKWGFSIAWCREPDGQFYWHVYHHQHGVRWGRAVSAVDAHHLANYAIGDLRNGV